MGVFDVIRKLFAARPAPCGVRTVEEFATRLGLSVDELRAARPTYREFSIPKRSGGTRRILAPEPELKSIQKRILKRLLGRLKVHSAVCGFERGRSIVTNANCHCGQAIILRMDLKEFFESTSAERVARYFGAIGWDREASQLLVRLCTHDNGLPQGAPTSPRLSNLVNFHLDARLDGLGGKYGAVYTRYADDLTFSFASDAVASAHAVIRATKAIVAKMGYRLHQRRKLHIRRRHTCQLVTGLVVNKQVNLPRETRRLLRAVEHRLAMGRQTSISQKQLNGWNALRAMIANQAEPR
ncbi:MAG: reverse transcriptase family protein [Gemmataceae bacterium]